MNRKKIIIIGASSGIGRELAQLYAAQNHLVGVTGRRTHLLLELAQAFPGTIVPAAFDLTAEDNLEHIEALIKKLGGLDLLIYNAGYGDTSDTLNPVIENTTVAINVAAFTKVVAFAFNYFVEKGKGHIGVTSSISAIRGNSWAPAYSASKAYMSRYAESLNLKAHRLKKDIVVTDVRPGFVDTKEATDHKRFWVASPVKAALQIYSAICRKKRVVYITKRWWLIGQLVRLIPFFLYKRIV